MVVDLPPAPVEGPPLAAIEAKSSSLKVTQEQADQALEALRASLPGTQFLQAWPAEMPGLIAVKLSSGEVAYTDKSGRYFVFGLILDTASGAALDKQLEGQH